MEFNTSIEVNDGEYLSDVLQDIEIPESIQSEYLEGTYEVVSIEDENGAKVENPDE